MFDKWDGHTHTQFCHHGSDAPMEQYVERAKQLGFARYTLSEHPPLPQGWVDNARLMNELAMEIEDLPNYLDSALEAKKRFEGEIEVTVGLELDYLHGRTDFTDAIVDRWGKRLEDAVFSVHYLPGIGGMRCIDYTAVDFKEGLIAYYGSMDKVVEEYYDHVEQAIEYAAGLPMRKRIGHINLIEKFRTALPAAREERIRSRLQRILPKLEASGVGVDVNTAGFRVQTCGTSYVPAWFIEECLRHGIPCVYGSDSHRPEHVGSGWDWYERTMQAISPKLPG